VGNGISGGGIKGGLVEGGISRVGASDGAEVKGRVQVGGVEGQGQVRRGWGPLPLCIRLDGGVFQPSAIGEGRVSTVCNERVGGFKRSRLGSGGVYNSRNQRP